MSKGWSRFMHETLHHKLNSAIMAWYAGGRIFAFLLSGSSALAPAHWECTALCMVLQQPAGFCMCDVSNERNLPTQDGPAAAPTAPVDDRNRGGTEYRDAYLPGQKKILAR